MIACLGWLILLVILIIFMCSIMPWWIVLLFFGGAFIYNFFLCNDALFKIQSRPSRPMKNLERVKKEIEQQKKAKKKKRKKGRNTDYKTLRTTTFWGDASSTPNQLNKNIDNERYRAYREEQAAYDDFIASLDMED